MNTPSVQYEIEEEGLRSWNELVGDIHVLGSEGEIHHSTTYVDSWLACLAEGLDEALSKGRAVVEIPEERDPLHFERKGSGLTIQYADAVVEFTSVHDLEVELVRAARRLVGRAEALNLDRDGAFVNEVERLAAKQL